MLNKKNGGSQRGGSRRFDGVALGGKGVVRVGAWQPAEVFMIGTDDVRRLLLLGI